ncbi:MAG: NAD(P)H-dependent oxidoreductase [Bacteroidia bacterium]
MHLIIYAHPDEKSFNHAILQTVVSVYQNHKEEFHVIDLYRENFNPVLGLEELKGKTSDKVKQYQSIIQKSSDIIFIFPVWWFRSPAIMEGFFDKVFIPGFAYRFKKIIGKYGLPVPLLRAKRVRALITHGAPALPVKTIYVNAIKYRLLLGFLSFCFNIFKCRIYQFWSVPFVDVQKRKKYLKKVERITKKLCNQ